MTPIIALLVLTQTAEARLQGDALLKDVEILETAYKSMHPGLFRYQSPIQVDAKFAELKSRLKGGATLREAYLAFSEYAATIRCGHTYANFFNQEQSVVSALFNGRNRMPFLFRWVGEKMILTRWIGTSPALAPGTEIRSINGIPCRDILHRLLRISRADGSNDFKRKAYLNLEGNDKWEAFDIFLPLYFPSVSQIASLEFSQFASKRTSNLSVSLMTPPERAAAVKPPTDNDAQWQFEVKPHGVGYLKMPTWALYNTKWNWQSFLNNTFSTLANQRAKGLIIDLRGNEGGNDVGDEILRHLVTHQTEFSALQRYTRYKKADATLNDYLDTWDRSFLDWGADAKNPEFNSFGRAVFYRMTRFDDGAASNLILPATPHFGGKVIVLMDSDNSSATFQFEQKVQSRHLGVLLGVPSGGNLRGINGGAFFFLHLPNSRIEMDLPLVATLPDSQQPDRGLFPDVFVPTTQADIAKKLDRAMEMALRVATAN